MEIGGGQFSSARGHHANFTINFNRVFLFSCVNCSQLTDGILTALESTMDDTVEDDIVRNLPQSMSFLC